ncbi:MAG: hypothetical protein ABIE55_03260 [Candidatus Aenigmatarchaeota archaeon]
MNEWIIDVVVIVCIIVAVTLFIRYGTLGDALNDAMNSDDWRTQTNAMSEGGKVYLLMIGGLIIAYFGLKSLIKIKKGKETNKKAENESKEKKKVTWETLRKRSR